MILELVEKDLLNVKTFTEDELIAREILNVCSSISMNFESEENITLFSKIKARHIILAKKFIKDAKTNTKDSVVGDMSIFEYVIENILSAPIFESDEMEDDIYV